MLKTLGILLKRQTIFPISYSQNSNKHFHSLLIKKVSNYKKEYITKGAVYKNFSSSSLRLKVSSVTNTKFCKLLEKFSKWIMTILPYLNRDSGQ